MSIINNGCEIKNGTLYLADKDKGISTEKIKTQSDCLSLIASGCITRGGARLLIIGVTSERKQAVLTEWELCKDFNITHTFDPINLAVYRDMQEFYVELNATTDATEFSVSQLTLAEKAEAVSENADTYVKSTVKARAVPNKMLFIGNSLVFGMGMSYGMCSTAPDKDYFHYVSEYVRERNQGCIFGKLYGSSFEHLESSDDFQAWFYTDANAYTGKPAKESFTEDTELIIIQLGDNINTEEKNDAFRKSGDMLIENIKKHSPNADIIWINGWYNRQPTFDLIASLCERWDIQRIDIRDLRCPENENHTDKLYMGKDGTPCEIKDTWRTHPGNLGMKAIAERIIENLGF